MATNMASLTSVPMVEPFTDNRLWAGPRGPAAPAGGFSPPQRQHAARGTAERAQFSFFANTTSQFASTNESFGDGKAN